jgi:hypothetical protein
MNINLESDFKKVLQSIFKEEILEKAVDLNMG